MAIVESFGRQVKVDLTSQMVEQGRFARVCIEIDLSIPVLSKVWINDR